MAVKALSAHLRSLVQRIRAKVDARRTERRSSPPGAFPPALQCRIAYNRHGGFCVPLSSRHRPAARMILSGEIHEPETVEFVASHCGAGDVIHAGTYFGPLLPAFSRALAPGARLRAFEPNLENYRCARITLWLNGLENVELVHAGLGERRDSRILETTDSDRRALGGASRILPQGVGANSDRSERVEIVTIDEMVPKERNVSIIQLDVEGYEQLALTGALDTVRRCRPLLVLESMPGEDWLYANLLALGYRVGQRVHANTVLAPG